MKIAEKDESYKVMLPELEKARFGSHLILPFRIEGNKFRKDWADQMLTPVDLTTSDFTEIVQSMLSRDGRISIGDCWRISRTVLFREMTDGALDPEKVSLYVEKGDIRRGFSLTDSWLYVFHTHVAFLALGIFYEDVSTLRDIVNPGHADSSAIFGYEDASGSQTFVIENWINNLSSKAGLQSFFSTKGSPFLEAFIHSFGLVPKRFPDLDVMKQASFNIHIMEPFHNPVRDSSEEDIRFVYSVIDHDLGDYRWGSCISSQSLSTITAERSMDLDRKMQLQAGSDLVIVMLMLYEKYTCLRYIDVIATTDLHHLKEIRKLKTEMLEFQAYGTLTPANLSRWHNVRNIYGALLDVNDIPEAIKDVDHKISILSEYQRKIESRKLERMERLVTAFGAFSILSSVLSIIESLTKGSAWSVPALILTALVLLVVYSTQSSEEDIENGMRHMDHF